MKVILLQDIKSVGRKYDEKDMPAGYVRNFLIPQKLGQIATPALIKIAKKQREQMEGARNEKENAAAEKIAKIEKEAITITRAVNEKGHLFAGINADEISKIIKESADIEIDALYIHLDQPIKDSGEHKIPLKAGGKKAELTLVIEGEEK